MAAIAGAIAAGLIEGGVLPVLKHIPGHGRATADSHEKLPVVSTDRATLEATDFAAFRPLKDLPLGMTAHVVFTAFDPVAPATTSVTIVRSVIRDSIGFRGLLMSDDISMGALSGSLGERSKSGASPRAAIWCSIATARCRRCVRSPPPRRCLRARRRAGPRPRSPRGNRRSRSILPRAVRCILRNSWRASAARTGSCMNAEERIRNRTSPSAAATSRRWWSTSRALKVRSTCC